jgi:uncharacterized protein YcbK (DUF882 family)
VAPAPALATATRTAKTRVVCSGQRLEAKRLTLPSPERSDDDGGRHRPTAEEKTTAPIVKASLSVGSAAPTRHRVMQGETLAQIAARYGTSVAALSASNGLGKTGRVRVGQILSLPAVAKAVPKSWQPYVKPTKQKGYLDVSTPSAHFSGAVVDSDGRLRSSAVRTLNELLGASGAHPALPERLIRLLVQVSDTFAGRPIRLVSGYRTTSYYQDSRHKLSSAVDFFVVGVPNAVICDYLRELEDVGVGYYPNSSFVHLDVRNHFAYWVDYAGPGEPPRSSPNAPSAPSAPSAPRRADRKLLAELDTLLKQTQGAIEPESHEPAVAAPPARELEAREPQSRLTEPTHGEASASDGAGPS